MADFIEPIVEWALAVLREKTPELLEEAGLAPFAEFGKSWTGVVMNWPPVAVMPRATQFDREGQTRHSDNGITIRFGVSGADRDQITTDAMRYMKAIDRAIEGADWIDGVSQVFISMHDYGPLYQASGGGFARFPEMHIAVEVYEA